MVRNQLAQQQAVLPLQPPALLATEFDVIPVSFTEEKLGLTLTFNVEHQNVAVSKNAAMEQHIDANPKPNDLLGSIGGINVTRKSVQDVCKTVHQQPSRPLLIEFMRKKAPPQAIPPQAVRRQARMGSGVLLLQRQQQEEEQRVAQHLIVTEKELSEKRIEDDRRAKDCAEFAEVAQLLNEENLALEERRKLSLAAFGKKTRLLTNAWTASSSRELWDSGGVDHMVKFVRTTHQFNINIYDELSRLMLKNNKHVVSYYGFDTDLRIVIFHKKKWETAHVVDHFPEGKSNKKVRVRIHSATSRHVEVQADLAACVVLSKKNEELDNQTGFDFFACFENPARAGAGMHRAQREEWVKCKINRTSSEYCFVVRVEGAEGAEEIIRVSKENTFSFPNKTQQDARQLIDKQRRAEEAKDEEEAAREIGCERKSGRRCQYWLGLSWGSLNELNLLPREMIQTNGREGGE
jgi:hypothetical protein